MPEQKKINYWALQIKSTDFQLVKALRANALKVYPVKISRAAIRKGDKIIIWKSGKNAGCYALATATSDPGNWPYPKDEKPFFKNPIPDSPNIHLKIDLNLWSNPLLMEHLSDHKQFNRFATDLPGYNYKVSRRHYDIISEIAKQKLLERNEQRQAVPFHKSTDHPLNLILYGPPGTGKTYNAISLAVAIIENKSLEKVSKIDRLKLRARFNDYMTEGQIGFVTFHHAYSYEDFVEGVKPSMEDQSVVYTIEEGIFKQMAFEAKRNMLETLLNNIPRKEINISFNQLYKAFVQYIKGAQFSYFVTAEQDRFYLHRIARNGDFIVRKENTFNTNSVPKSKLRNVYENITNIQDHEMAEAEIIALTGTPNAELIYGVLKELKAFETEYIKALAMLQQGESNDSAVESFEVGALNAVIKDQTKKYVLIIDEINRGNISNIFGELITLLEEDKREGNVEGLVVQLPFSKSYFSVPSNLYIIGTMNTAGRDIERMDLALRRRFDFIEMEPDPSVIKMVNKTQFIDGINLAKMLIAINERIELLIGRDYRIGHSYFLNLTSLADLQSVFSHKIIPLLMDYFEGDLLQIGLVLGKDFVCKNELKSSDAFADFDHVVFETDSLELCTLHAPEALPNSAFIRIYDSGYKE